MIWWLISVIVAIILIIGVIFLMDLVEKYEITSYILLFVVVFGLIMIIAKSLHDIIVAII